MDTKSSQPLCGDVAADQLVTFRASALASELGQRLNRDKKTVGSTAKADLSRYYVLLKLGRDSMAGKFSSNEVNLIAEGVYEECPVDLLDLGWWERDAARAQKTLLVYKIRDALRKYPLEKTFDADASLLVEKIETLSALEIAALIDTIERYRSLRPQTEPSSRGWAETYDALDFTTSDRPRLTILPRPTSARKGATNVATNRQKNLADTVRDYLNDPKVHISHNRATAVLHVTGLLAGAQRHITFGEVACHSLEGLDDQQRAAVIETLFENAATWPEGIADVRFTRDGVVISSMVSETDIYVFVGDEPVSRGVRISTPMVAT